MKKIVLALACFALTGCQAMMYGTAADLNDLRIGMSKSEVLAVMGTPMLSEANADIDEETLIYKRMRHVVTWGPKPYHVTLRGGKVVSYGEQK